jgi:hypothetical protein
MSYFESMVIMLVSRGEQMETRERLLVKMFYIELGNSKTLAQKICQLLRVSKIFRNFVANLKYFAQNETLFG